MAIKCLSIANYRSIRDLRFRLKGTNVLTGPNGCGKSNLYNALVLLSKAANGGLAQAIVEEGGMDSVLWAGQSRRNESCWVTIEVATDLVSYSISCGLPPPDRKAFHLDPEIKAEYVWSGGEKRRPNNTFFARSSSGIWARDRAGARVSYSGELPPGESVLSQLSDPHLYPELSALRREIANWRFYHHFRTDPASPLRHPQISVYTPILSHDGRDLAAALETISACGGKDELDETIGGAFSGAGLLIHHDRSRFELALDIPGLLRPLSAREISDGTLRYLCLTACLLSPRLPSLLALNEPESTLHPDLLPHLAKLIARAARSSQIWITTHSRALVEHIEAFAGERRVELELVNGETKIVGQGLIYHDDGE